MLRIQFTSHSNESNGLITEPFTGDTFIFPNHSSSMDIQMSICFCSQLTNIQFDFKQSCAHNNDWWHDSLSLSFYSIVKQKFTYLLFYLKINFYLLFYLTWFLCLLITFFFFLFFLLDSCIRIYSYLSWHDFLEILQTNLFLIAIL